jgi:hypothetical protein
VKNGGHYLGDVRVPSADSKYLEEGAPKLREPAQEQAEVVAGGGKDRV